MSTIYGHNDKIVLDYLKNNPDTPYFISYPRTGSHWIRLVMEEYFEKPSLVVLFKKGPDNGFTCYHTHDLVSDGITTGSIEKSKVIYLYRDISETIYSNLKYNNKNLNDTEEIKKYSNSYAINLTKWLEKCEGDSNKLILSYENFKEDFPTEFKKLTDFFSVEFDREKLFSITEGLSKNRVKTSSGNRYSKINDSKAYNDSREVFVTKHKDLCENTVFERNVELKKYFK